MAKSNKTEVEVSSDSKVKITTAKTKDGKKKIVTTVVRPQIVSRQVGGFINFLREHTVITLAVGFVLATQVQGVVKQLIASFINPLFALVFPGDKTLSVRTFTINIGSRHAVFGWGAMVYEIIDFLFIVATIYAIIKLLKLDKLDKAKT